MLTLSFTAGLLLTGCPNPNTYGTPRTTPAGKLAHTVAAEGVGFRFEDTDGSSVSGGFVAPPTYMLRIGVADRLDLGLRVNNLASFGADAKFNFVRSEALDLAIDPGLQWLNVGFNVVHVHAPLLLGLNVSDTLSIVLSPGVMYGTNDFEQKTGEELSELEQLTGSTGLQGRFGVGFDIRVSKKFAVHPEATVMRSFQEPTDSEIGEATLYMMGVGFNFGNLPDFSDVNDASEE